MVCLEVFSIIHIFSNSYDWVTVPLVFNVESFSVYIFVWDLSWPEGSGDT